MTSAPEDKCSPRLQRLLEHADEDDRFEVIARLRFPLGDRRRPVGSGDANEISDPADEMNALMEALHQFLQQNLSEDDDTEIVDASWLVHSAFLRATPVAILLLATSDLIEALDINTEHELRGHA